MNLLFLDQSGQLGGAELMLLDVVRHLPAKVVLFQDGPFAHELKQAGIPCEVVALDEAAGRVTKKSGAWEAVRAGPALARLVFRLVARVRAADVVCVNTPKALVLGALACLIARKPLVYWLHDLLTPEHFSRAQLHLLTFLSRACACRVIANSDATGAALRGAGFPVDRITVIPNGFDLSHFENLSVLPGANLREALGIGDAPVAAMAGRFARWKGQDVFIRALARVPGLHGWLIGEALFTEEDREFALGLPLLARELGCGERVHFLGFRSDVPELFASSQMVVHASTKAEPFGRVIVEGMLAGRAVIATAQGGAAEILEHGATGLLIESGDDIALADAMARLLACPDEAARMGEAAAATARSRYALPQVVEKMKKVFASAARLSETSR